MCHALHLLQSHAYQHDDVLSACELLTARVAQMVNAAASGNSAETYKQFEPLLPRLCQTHIAFNMIPPEKIKNLHAHSKMMTSLTHLDKSKKRTREQQSSNRFQNNKRGKQ